MRVLLGGRRVTGCRSAVQVLHFYPVSCCVSLASFVETGRSDGGRGSVAVCAPQSSAVLLLQWRPWRGPPPAAPLLRLAPRLSSPPAGAAAPAPAAPAAAAAAVVGLALGRDPPPAAAVQKN